MKLNKEELTSLVEKLQSQISDLETEEEVIKVFTPNLMSHGNNYKNIRWEVDHIYYVSHYGAEPILLSSFRTPKYSGFLTNSIIGKESSKLSPEFFAKICLKLEEATPQVPANTGFIGLSVYFNDYINKYTKEKLTEIVCNLVFTNLYCKDVEEKDFLFYPVDGYEVTKFNVNPNGTITDKVINEDFFLESRSCTILNGIKNDTNKQLIIKYPGYQAQSGRAEPILYVNWDTSHINFVYRINGKPVPVWVEIGQVGTYYRAENYQLIKEKINEIEQKVNGFITDNSYIKI